MCEPAFESLNVHNEIGQLRKVMLHRPGEELNNLIPGDLERLLFDDIPYLEGARREHDRFADTLREQGVEVLYIERLVAEALDAVPSAREEYTQRWIEESGLEGMASRAAVKEFMDAIDDTQTFVDKSIAGIRRSELGLSSRAGETRGMSLADVEEGRRTGLLVDPMPNVYFTRDAFAVVGRGVCLNRMCFETRRRETLLGEFVFRYHPTYRGAPLWYRREEPFHMEGGDVTNLSSRVLAIGISQRTQAAAIDRLAQTLLWDDERSEVEELLAFKIPSSRAFMHLDTVFTQVDVDKFTIHPGIMGTLEVFSLSRGVRQGEVAITEIHESLEHILEAAMGLDRVTLLPCGAGDAIEAAREQWNDGSNTLCVSPGRICVYDRNAVSNDYLARNGLELLVIPSSELSRGRGGPRCMSMPFWRDELV